MKKMIGIVLTVICVLSLAACGGKAAESGAGENNEAETVNEAGGEASDSMDETSGDAAGEEEGTFKVGSLYATLSIDFCKGMQEGVNEAAAENGVQIIEGVYDIDANKGSEIIQNFINQKVDAIVMQAIDSEAFAPSVEAAKEAGIVVVAIDGRVNTQVDCWVASDNTEGGILSGDFIGQYLNGEGEVLIITSEPGNVTMVERNKGFHTGLEKYPNIKITEVMDDGQNGVEGYSETVENALNANPNYDVIITGYSDVTNGALAAIEMNIERFGEIKVMGYDADEAMLEKIASGESPLIGTIAQEPKVIGRLGLENAYKVLKGETVEEEVGAEVSLITFENISEYMAQ